MKNLLATILVGWASAQAQAQEPEWKQWDEWDRVTKSYAPIDSTVESRKDVLVARVVLNPDLPPFILVYRRSSDYCGSAGVLLKFWPQNPLMVGNMCLFSSGLLTASRSKASNCSMAGTQSC